MTGKVQQKSGLAVRGLRVELIKRTVLDDIDLCVNPGRPTLLLGPNGAGKSTLLHALAGFYPCRAGSIHLNGQDMTNWSPSARGRAGVATQFQRPRLFPNLTVREHLLAASVPAHRYPLWTALFGRRRLMEAEAEASRRIDDELESLGLGEFAGRSPAELSYGQQKLVSLLRALFAGPRLLLCDEPLVGLSPTLKAVVLKRLEAVASSGVITLVVGHDVAAFQGVDWDAVFMDRGKALLTSPVGKLLGEERVIESYLGKADALVPQGACLPDAGLGALQIDRLSAGYGRQQVLDEISLSVEPGEILGLVGHNGSGKTTLLEAVFGFATRQGGHVRLAGEELQPNPPANARLGLTYVPQAGAFFDSLTVNENLAICKRSLGLVDQSRKSRGGDNLGGRLVGSLSGGERQGLVTDRIQLGRAKLIMLDEPSSGLAPTRCRDVARAIRSSWCSNGCPPMIVAEQNVSFLLELATEIAVLRQGRLSAKFPVGPGVLRRLACHLGFTGSHNGEGII